MERTQRDYVAEPGTAFFVTPMLATEIGLCVPHHAAVRPAFRLEFCSPRRLPIDVLQPDCVPTRNSAVSLAVQAEAPKNPTMSAVKTA